MAVVKHALDLGINFFDTANCYAHGTSEEFLGRAIKASGVARDKDIKYLEELYTPHKIVGAL